MTREIEGEITSIDQPFPILTIVAKKIAEEINAGCFCIYVIEGPEARAYYFRRDDKGFRPSCTALDTSDRYRPKQQCGPKEISFPIYAGDTFRGGLCFYYPLGDKGFDKKSQAYVKQMREICDIIAAAGD